VDDRDDVLRDLIDAVRCLNATLNKSPMSFQNYDAVFSDLLARLESLGEATFDPARQREKNLRFAERYMAQGEAKAVACRIDLSCGLRDGHDGECVAYWAVGAPPPPADEVSDEELREWAEKRADDAGRVARVATSALDQLSEILALVQDFSEDDDADPIVGKVEELLDCYRETEDDLAAALRERDEARAEAERLRGALERISKSPHHCGPKYPCPSNMARAALTPATEEPKS